MYVQFRSHICHDFDLMDKILFYSTTCQDKRLEEMGIIHDSLNDNGSCPAQSQSAGAAVSYFVSTRCEEEGK